MTRRWKPKVGNKVEALRGFSAVADAEGNFALSFYVEAGISDLIDYAAQKRR